jgi:hypothetical protein
VGRRTPGSTQQAMVAVLKVAGRVQQALADVCRGYGITHDQYNVLRILSGVHHGLIDRSRVPTPPAPFAETAGLLQRNRARAEVSVGRHDGRKPDSTVSLAAGPPRSSRPRRPARLHAAGRRPHPLSSPPRPQLRGLPLTCRTPARPRLRRRFRR